jgi:hypothetical protein
MVVLAAGDRSAKRVEMYARRDIGQQDAVIIPFYWYGSGMTRPYVSTCGSTGHEALKWDIRPLSTAKKERGARSLSNTRALKQIDSRGEEHPFGDTFRVP